MTCLSLIVLIAFLSSFVTNIEGDVEFSDERGISVLQDMDEDDDSDLSVISTYLDSKRPHKQRQVSCRRYCKLRSGKTKRKCRKLKKRRKKIICIRCRRFGCKVKNINNPPMDEGWTYEY